MRAWGIVLLLSLGLAAAGCGTDAPELVAADQPALGDAETSREVSATFTKFFEDTVNASSGTKWEVENDNGNKQWTLSNTCFSAPKAWVIGQNYWNNEDDTLTSIPFTVPKNREGLRLSFYARFSTVAPDRCIVQYQPGDGEDWITLSSLTMEGQNPLYPEWKKYSAALEDGTGNSAEDYRIRFRFTSNGSGTSWGCGIDSVTVYQTNVSPPQNLIASDGTWDGFIQVTWNHPADGTPPAVYKLYRSETYSGPYFQIATIDYPTAQWFDDPPADGPTYYYKVKGVRYGYGDSAYSNRDGGFSF